ncbi:MAG: hypothetical protein KA604_01600 [Candidatus Saccharimonas sp.]|jgi:hypothetical protein|nr:hypothetical protein [Candidatus Saccharimonas sp.]
MDNNTQSTQPISDDQELAKVLAGVNDNTDEASPLSSPAIETTAPTTPPPSTPLVTDDNTAQPTEDVVAPVPEPQTPAMSAPTPTFGAPVPAATGELDGVKREAISELRPLVDKLNLAPEEKFDTYLLLIRSTDDKSLVAPAHEAAKQIPDEARRAQALLDIIKEIDFLSSQQTQA